MEQLVNDLIKYFLEEASHPVIDVPKEYINKREFLRGLINVREPKQIPNEIIIKENELLLRELEQKNIIDIDSFPDKLSLWQGDITTIKCDAIVNYATSKLTGCFKPNHNCIDNKIHSYAGISLRLKCSEISRGEEIEVSKVVMTDGYNLPCDHIIHTVVPDVDNIDEEVEEDIKLCIINSLDLAKKNNLKKICIPNLTVKTDDKIRIAKLIVDTIKDYLRDDDFFEKVVLNVFTLDSYNIYKELI